MMHQLSVKGILLGVAASFETVYIWFLVMAIYVLLANYNEAIASPGGSPAVNAMIISVTNSPVLTVISYLIGICALLSGGYIAARMVDHHKLANGAVAAIIGCGLILGTIHYAPIFGILLALLIIPIGGLAIAFTLLLRNKEKRVTEV